MNFQLTKEQQMVREMVRDFAKNEIAPKAHEVDQSAVFPIDTFKKIGELGLLGIPFPEEYGGAAVTPFHMQQRSKKSEKPAAARG